MLGVRFLASEYCIDCVDGGRMCQLLWSGGSTVTGEGLRLIQW